MELLNQLLIPYLLAMALAITMGGSGTAPAFSASYGANVIRKGLIPGIFGMAVFVGAILAGKETASTMGKGILEAEYMNFTTISIMLFTVAFTLLIANIAGIPQSTSQVAVLALAAPAMYLNKLDSNKLFFEIIPMWFVLPIIAFFASYFCGKYIYQPMRRKGFTMQRAQNENLKPIWNILLILMSVYVSFAIGANNVANASGPISSMTINEMNLTDQNDFRLIMILSTLIVAPCFGIGSSLFGYKVVKNTGKEIILFGKFEAVIIAFISGSLLLSASLIKGIPTSLVQVNVAAILGIGVAKMGSKNIFRKTQVRNFFSMWMIAPVIGFALSFLLTYLADILGILDK
ncbi:inorganic phosphate transporter [Capnocytophaga catalasegens]|uniref:Anion permease n=1 Tax=Capnocytophaga catalasegens TaxID=1004260 RepID=A0AAV5AR13_9FLAO|nr:inorganic phosphate transporter [Capnocytophaga catalasegens]GIZ15223.1 anion permease [Capnocytophaga catalasegens]GJM49737.1 anion permease [Capnocytophaga catalasegens]GJM52802.1 anion permease [Capnocytophaga catalasegens]